MCSLLARRVRALSSCFYSSPPRYQNLAPLLFSSISTQPQTQPQKEELPFIAQYLISSFGFSSTRALKLSAYNNLAAIKSPAPPEAVVKFLSDTGLTDAQIKAAISLHPTLLAYSVDKTFKPKVRELINAGCSRELLVQLIRYNPQVLYLNGTLSRLLFWRDFIGNGDEGLLNIIPRNTLLFTLDIDKHIVPIINLLKDYGLSNPNILMFLQQGTRFMKQNLNSLRKTLELIEELGIPRGSTKFCFAFRALGGKSEDTIKRNVEFFKKTYHWSQEDVNSAFKKFPNVLTYSEENVKSKMDFLIREAKIEPSHIASYPSIFAYSLQRVLSARYNVLSALKAKGVETKCSLFTACHMSEKRFRENYVVPFEKDFPRLGAGYVADFGGKLPKL